MSGDRLPILGADGPVVIVSARDAWLLRDAWRKWVAENRAHGGARKVLAVDPVLRALEIAAAAHADRMMQPRRMSANGPADTKKGCPAEEWSQQVLNTDQAAAVLGITPRHVRRMAHSGELAGRRLAGTWTFEVQAVHDCLTDRRQRGTAA